MADEAAVERVKRAIETILSDSASPSQRQSAHQLIESVKEEYEQSASVGLALYARNTNSVQVRHIGLQLVEEHIKKRWNSLKKEEKDAWKKEAMLLLARVDIADVGHIKERLVRIVIEIAKREFPQNWSDFFSDLGVLQNKGSVQLELVLLVFLRLAEDVILALDPNLQSQRRKNIEQALSENVKDLFIFLITNLQTHVGLWRKNKQPMNLRLAEATLFTMSAYLGHIALEHVFANDLVLLQMLCQLLDEKELRMAAAECLVILVERRRDRIDQRLPILALFSDDAMDLFIEVARKACLAGAEEDSYNFVKKICDIIVGLGMSQLADFWGNDRGISKRPDTFERYLKLVLDMLNHPSQVICLKALAVCTTFFKHEHISKDEIFVDAVPYMMIAMENKLPKYGDPSDDNHPSCEFSAMDHDSSVEYSELFCKLRSITTGNIRECTVILPLNAFEHACQKIIKMTQKPTSLQDLIEWEALVMFCDAVMARFWRSEKVKESPELMEERGKSINIILATNGTIEALIQVQNTVPQIEPYILLCLQTFLPFFNISQQYLLATVEKILSTFSRFPLSESDKEIISTRRQATASFVNLCRHDSKYLLPYFDDFEQFVGKLEREGVVTMQELNTLTEGLLLLSNGMLPERRERLFNSLLSRLDELTSSTEFKLSLESTENFIRYIGLTEIPSESSPAIPNRHKIASFINLFLAIVRRVQLSDSEKAFLTNGSGFFNTSVGCSWIQKSMAYLPHITGIIKDPFSYSAKEADPRTFRINSIKMSLDPDCLPKRHMGLIWSAQMQSQIHKDYLPAFKLTENDRVFLLGQHVTRELKEAPITACSVIAKTSTFFYTMHNQSYSLLGLIGGLFQDHFYDMDGLADLIINTVMSSWVHLPKYRFITVLKFFFKPFISSCPPASFVKVVGPIMSVTLDYMLKLLSKEWSEFNQEAGTSVKLELSAESEENPSDEVIEERLIHSLSREYIEMLVSFFYLKKKNQEEISLKEGSTDASQPEVGELGKFFLLCEATNSNAILTSFTALTWPDTVSVNKVTRVIPHLINFIAQSSSSDAKIDASIIDHLFLCILKGLQVHGAELSAQGSLLTAALLMYMKLRVAYPSLVHIMLMVPTCKKELLMKFDLDVFESECKLTDKKKRETFKKFLSGAFGKNISEIHKADVKIKDLPPLAPRKPVKPQNDNAVDSICNLFGGE